MVEVEPAPVRISASALLGPPMPSWERQSAKPESTGLSTWPDSASAGERASVGVLAAVIYIDRQRLSRDCISERLANCFPEWRIEAAASVSELQNDCSWRRASLIVLYT